MKFSNYEEIKRRLGFLAHEGHEITIVRADFKIRTKRHFYCMECEKILLTFDWSDEQ